MIGRNRVACAHSPRAASIATNTTLPVWALANTPSCAT
jgi:hypothetical protein